jgi:hypothetical protein
MITPNHLDKETGRRIDAKVKPEDLTFEMFAPSDGHEDDEDGNGIQR